MHVRRSFALLAFAAALAGCHDKTPRPIVIADGIAYIQLTANYGFMSLDSASGPSEAFAANYSDSASFAATGFGTLLGRGAIERFLYGQGHGLRVSEFRRLSQGRAIKGAYVCDSGSYELVGQQGRRPTDLDPVGRYWAVWEFTQDAKWRIVADTLIGDKRTRADLAPRSPAAPQ